MVFTYSHYYTKLPQHNQQEVSTDNLRRYKENLCLSFDHFFTFDFFFLFFQTPSLRFHFHFYFFFSLFAFDIQKEKNFKKKTLNFRRKEKNTHTHSLRKHKRKTHTMVKVANGNFSDQFVLQRLTSEVYGVENPPRDWADVGLLIPHECIRREMHHMLNGIDKLIRRIEQGRLKPWHVLYFCEWFIDVFEPFVISHHEAEERLYFPWIASKADFPQGKKKFAHGHTLLSSLMDGIGNLCENVIEKKGLDCNEEIRSLWKQMHIFVAEMNGKF